MPKKNRMEPYFWALRYVHVDNPDVIFFAWVAAGVGAPGWFCFSPAWPDRTKPGEPDRTGKLVKPCGPQHDDDDDEVWGGRWFIIVWNAEPRGFNMQYNKE